MIWKTVPKISCRTELCLSEETCLHILSFCNSQSLKEGVCVHSPIIKLGLQNQLYLNNNLLSLYEKCFGVEKARNFFDEMRYKDVVSWTGILSAYNKNKSYEQAVELYHLMVGLGEKPNEFTLSCILRSCFAMGEFDLGTRILAYMIKCGYESNPVLGSILIDLYSKCDLTGEAQKIFKYTDNHDTVLWTTMISSLVQGRNWSRALQLYPHMIEAGVPPNEFTFTKFLAASSFLSLNYGKLVHALLIMWGIKLNLVLKTALVDMYMKSQRMEDALKVSELTPEYDVLLWSTIICGFAQNLKFSEAIAAFCEMEISGIQPNNYTFSGVLNACSSILALELGKQIHSRVIMAGLENDVSVGNALLNLYTRFSHMLENALRAFRRINSPNVISWTSLISGFAKHGLEKQSFDAFVEMQLLGVQPNSFTLSMVLQACATMKSITQTRKVHGFIVKTNADSDIVVDNALVDCYAGLGMVDDAWCIISMMNQRDAITYTSLATRENEMGNHEMALNIITYMFNDDIKMDGFSLACFLSASTCSTAMETGKQLHCYAVKYGLVSWISVSNALVDFYGKCGCINDAHCIFGEISEPDVVSWNGMIYGLASNGSISLALSAFDDMRLTRVKPDPITFLLVLYACSHGGLVDLGFEYFQCMSESHGIVPQLDHYVCLVDLFGRAGRLEEAMRVIETMPIRPDALIYKTLLSACKLHGNIPLGEDMARRGFELDSSDPAFYVLLANMYDDFGRSDLGEKTRRLMREKGLRKNTGQSWMEIRSKIHAFVAGDRSHPQINEIHEKIEHLITEFKIRGYICPDNRESSYHSERLAVAFGLLNMPSVAPIRIFKNIRICRDCHQFIMTLTQLVDREIIVRDGNRFHSFKNGACSCGGYW